MILAGVAQLVRASSHTRKGGGFDSQSRQVPGLCVWSPVCVCGVGGACRRQPIELKLSHWCSSLLPSSVSKKPQQTILFFLKNGLTLDNLLSNLKKWYDHFIGRKVPLNKIQCSYMIKISTLATEWKFLNLKRVIYKKFTGNSKVNCEKLDE